MNDAELRRLWEYENVCLPEDPANGDKKMNKPTTYVVTNKGDWSVLDWTLGIGIAFALGIIIVTLFFPAPHVETFTFQGVEHTVVMDSETIDKGLAFCQALRDDPMFPGLGPMEEDSMCGQALKKANKW